MTVRWKSPIVWFRGVWAAFVSGGASSVTSGLVAGNVAPEKFNFSGGLKNTLFLIGCTFLINGILGLAFYLAKSPAPEVFEEDTQPPFKPLP